MSAFKDGISAINAAGELRRLAEAASKFWDFNKKIKTVTTESNMHQATIKRLLEAIAKHQRANAESTYPRKLDFDGELYAVLDQYRDILKEP